MPERTVGVVFVAAMVVGGLALLQGGGGPAPQSAVQRASTRRTPTPQAAEPITCDVDARCTAATFFAPGTVLSDDAAAQALWLQHCGDFQFVVALVPDPVDSHIGWMFDPAVESIERAAEAGGFALDRFRLPWGAEATAKAQCAGAASGGANGSPQACGAALVHEREPGVLVFRPVGPPRDTVAANANGGLPHWNDNLLIVFLVGETPTGGIQKQAFTEALDRVSECRNESIEVLGPTFSGSARSLAISIQGWWSGHQEWVQRNITARAALQDAGEKARAEHCNEHQENPAWCKAYAARPITPFQIISGTATSFPLDELRRAGTAPDGVDVASFSATVVPDEVMFKKFINCYMGERLGVDPAQIALLIEANTGYGQAARTLGAGSRSSAAGGSPEADAANAAGASTNTVAPAATLSPGSVPTPTPESCDGWARDADILRLPFPMYIAGARSAWEKVKEAPTPGVPNAASPRLQMALDEMREPPDMLPQMSPGMTGPAVEMVLANILATISRKNIRYVGVLASDTRDKLFLVQQIRKYCPDVNVFTFENDLFYAHPDLYAAFRGTLVAATYPLFSRTQPWTGKPQARRLQFSSSAAQGIYNAFLPLLGGDAEYLMIDYDSPRADFGTGNDILVSRQPPIWISAVGNGGLWPVAEFNTDTSRGYIYRQKRPWKGKDTPQGETGSARSAVMIWAVLSAFSLMTMVRFAWIQACWLVSMQRQRHQPATARSAYWPRARHRMEQRICVILGFVCLTLLYAYVSSFFYLKPEAVGRIGQVVIVVTLALLLAGIGDSVAALASGVRRWPYAAIVRAALALAIVAVTVIAGLLYEPSGGWLAWNPLLFGLPADARRTQFMLDYERVLNLESNLSPLLPVTFVMSILYLWSWCQLQRLWLIEFTAAPNPLAQVSGLAGAGFPQIESAIRRIIGRPWKSVVIVPAALWVLVCAAFYSSFLPTVEGRVFDGIFKLAFLLASVTVVLSSTHAYTLWLHVHRFFERLSLHPIAAAFGVLPERIAHRVRESLYAYVPSLADQELLIRRWQRLARHRPTAAGDPFAGLLDPPAVVAMKSTVEVGLPAAEAELLAALATPYGADTEEKSRGLQHYLNDVAARLARSLERVWNGDGLTRETKKKDGDAASEPKADAKAGADNTPKAWLLDAEELVATQVVTYVGQVFAHIRNSLAFVTVGLLLLLMTVPSYPFQPQRLLNMFAWGLVLAVVSGALWVSVQMNRSEVLSRMTGSTPNQVTFNRTLIRDLAIYGGIPLLSLLATQFPSIGGSLFSWVEPALRAMK